ncbi:hypothetical protein PD5205_03417 [Xanthomonas fragariae]|uniref:Uncharacterized protein n=1 Tax=Xanthomonas fragariae TaxID=48664 RepID=A0A1Y6HTB6_9XANT|nr:hypothetical protein NBC2815_00367 [Xanthomonas fragariae]SMQ97841.1 hypothetical protein PD885_00573 [Xanthomonas fragariae]SMR04693.1 hypothetical protein PD5205_03417 [Xanthomonas fragariae]
MAAVLTSLALTDQSTSKCATAASTGAATAVGRIRPRRYGSDNSAAAPVNVPSHTA